MLLDMQVLSGINKGSNCGYHMYVRLLCSECIFVLKMFCESCNYLRMHLFVFESEIEMLFVVSTQAQ